MHDAPEPAARADLLHRSIALHADRGPWPYAASLIHHRGFRDALRLYCAAVIQRPEMPWPADKFFGQRLRYLVSFSLIGLDARWRRGGGEAPTLATLQRVAPASARQIAELVVTLRLGGYVTAQRLPADRRALRLSPSMTLLQEIGRSPLAFLEASERLVPAASPMVAKLRLDAAALADWLGASYEMFLQEDVYFGPFCNVVEFTGQDCGYSVLSAVLATHYAALSGVAAPAPLSYSGLAERFRVSRQHIGNILSSAERRGCFSVARGGRSVAISADFLSEFETWAAGQMAHYRVLAERV
ncbi:MarR family transcriptional regulator [Bosea lupini]|nr:MarR family transcriptional regulator [Bosea lupini]